MRPFQRVDIPASSRGRARVLARGAGLVALAVLVSACGRSPQSALDPAGPFAQRPDDLFQIVFWIAVFVFVLVQGLIVYTVVRFREKPDDRMPRQIHGNTKLEIFWTVVPALILAAIAVPTVQMVFELDAEPEGALTVEVTGHRWWWEFRYPESGVVTANELVIPVDRPIRLEMTAADPGDSPDRGVIHSFWIPALAGKQDLVPGRISTLNIQADEPGRYIGQCGEYCGLSHANMRTVAEALPTSEFEAWIASQLEPPAEPEPGTLAAQGKELLGQTQDAPVGAAGNACVQCHRFEPGEAGAGGIGPNLSHLMSRETFAARLYEINETNLRRWLEDPPAMKPMQPASGIGMPDLNLTDEEIDALVAYLLTLE